MAGSSADFISSYYRCIALKARPISLRLCKVHSSVVQSQKAVSAYFTRKQVLPFCFAEQSSGRARSADQLIYGDPRRVLMSPPVWQRAGSDMARQHTTQYLSIALLSGLTPLKLRECVNFNIPTCNYCGFGIVQPFLSTNHYSWLSLISVNCGTLMSILGHCVVHCILLCGTLCCALWHIESYFVAHSIRLCGTLCRALWHIESLLCGTLYLVCGTLCCELWHIKSYFVAHGIWLYGALCCAIWHIEYLLCGTLYLAL